MRNPSWPSISLLIIGLPLAVFASEIWWAHEYLRLLATLVTAGLGLWSLSRWICPTPSSWALLLSGTSLVCVGANSSLPCQLHNSGVQATLLGIDSIFVMTIGLVIISVQAFFASKRWVANPTIRILACSAAFIAGIGALYFGLVSLIVSGLEFVTFGTFADFRVLKESTSVPSLLSFIALEIARPVPFLLALVPAALITSPGVRPLLKLLKRLPLKLRFPTATWSGELFGIVRTVDVDCRNSGRVILSTPLSNSVPFTLMSGSNTKRQGQHFKNPILKQLVTTADHHSLAEQWSNTRIAELLDLLECYPESRIGPHCIDVVIPWHKLQTNQPLARAAELSDQLSAVH